MSNAILITFTNLLYLISQIGIVVICFWFFSKKKSTESALLALGSFVELCLTCIYQFVMPYLMNSGSNFNTMNIYPILGVVSALAAGCFAVGLFLLIRKTVVTKTTFFNQFPPNNEQI